MEQNKDQKSVFAVLNAINVNEHAEVKDIGPTKLTYLSWAWAWAKVKEHFPEANYEIHHNAQGWNYHTDGRTCWVETTVTINGLPHTEHLPVMDNRNQSVAADKVTSMDVNKAIQRCLTKAAARHGLGLYIYAGEDLPEEEARKNAETAASDLPVALEEVKACKTNDDISNVWNKWKKIHPEYVKQGHPFFVAATSADVEFV